MKKRTVRKWSEEAEEALQGSFEATDWISLCQPYEEDITAMTECVTPTELSLVGWVVCLPFLFPSCSGYCAMDRNLIPFPPSGLSPGSLSALPEHDAWHSALLLSLISSSCTFEFIFIFCILTLKYMYLHYTTDSSIPTPL